MKIGWFYGKNDWAYRYHCKLLMENMPEIEHNENEAGEVNIVMTLHQLTRERVEPTKTVFRFGGSREITEALEKTS